MESKRPQNELALLSLPEDCLVAVAGFLTPRELARCDAMSKEVGHFTPTCPPSPPTHPLPTHTVPVLYMNLLPHPTSFLAPQSKRDEDFITSTRDFLKIPI